MPETALILKLEVKLLRYENEKCIEKSVQKGLPPYLGDLSS